MERKAIRHGDLALFPIGKLPEGLTASTSKVIMTGSHGNDHSFDNGKFYSKEMRNGKKITIGYFVADNTTLIHPEHGCMKNGKQTGRAKIADGVWECRRQVEDTNTGMKPVID